MSVWTVVISLITSGAASAAISAWWNARTARSLKVLETNLQREGLLSVEERKDFLRREFEPLLEAKKGEIRRDVERDLKTHESVLRTVSEMRIRRFERDMQLAREVTQAMASATFGMRGVVLTLFTRLNWDEAREPLTTLIERASHLGGLIAQIPPAHRADALIRLREALADTILKISDTINKGKAKATDLRESMDVAVKAIKSLQPQLDEATAIVERWMDSVQKEERDLLNEFRRTASDSS